MTAHSADAAFDKLKDNPFEGADFVILLIDTMVMEFRKLKFGRQVKELSPWQTFPLQWRNTMNELFLLLDKGIEDGWWCLYDERLHNRMEWCHSDQQSESEGWQ